MDTNYTYKEVYHSIAADEGWHHQLEQEVVQLAPNAWGFIGYGTSNFGVIASEHGYILIDAGDCPTRARAAVTEIQAFAPGKLQAILFTHSHPDHRASAYVFAEDAEDEIPIYGHYNFGAEQKAGAGLDAALGRRTAAQFGVHIPDEAYTPNFMVPRFENNETGPLLGPNTFVAEGGMELEIDGVRLQLLTLPSETPDHVQVWLPEERVLFCGDSAYGSFPNLYPLRGGPYRDVEAWARCVRELAKLKPAALLCGHVLALRGEAEIAAFLDDYASALEHVYNKTIAGMNEGKTADELAAEIRLPEELRNKPYLAEYYGNVAWSVRAIFTHKAGWFDGNPANIAPLTPLEQAQHMATLAGGADALLARAVEALEAGDERWAAQVAQHVLALVEAGEAEAALGEQAREVLAGAYDHMAAAVLPITAKNYLQSAALELRN